MSLTKILRQKHLGANCFLPGTTWYTDATQEWIFRARQRSSNDKFKRLSFEQSRLIFKDMASFEELANHEIYPLGSNFDATKHETPKFYTKAAYQAYQQINQEGVTIDMDLSEYKNIVSGISVSSNFLPLNRPWIVYGLSPQSKIPCDLAVIQDAPPLFEAQKPTYRGNFHRVICPMDGTTLSNFGNRMTDVNDGFNTVKMDDNDIGQWRKVYRIPKDDGDSIQSNLDHLPTIRMTDTGVQAMMQLFHVNKRIALKIWDNCKSLHETIEDTLNVDRKLLDQWYQLINGHNDGHNDATANGDIDDLLLCCDNELEMTIEEPKSFEEYIAVPLAKIPGIIGRAYVYYFRKMEIQLFDLLNENNFVEYNKLELKLTELYEWGKYWSAISKLNVSKELNLHGSIRMSLTQSNGPTFCPLMKVPKRHFSDFGGLPELPHCMLTESHIRLLRDHPEEAGPSFIPLYLSPVAREAMITYYDDLTKNKKEIEEFNGYIDEEFDWDNVNVPKQDMERYDQQLYHLYYLLNFYDDEIAYLVHNKFYDKLGIIQEKALENDPSFQFVAQYTQSYIAAKDGKHYLRPRINK